jgi:polyvinyl alcohol dehydrogenase (cytochrome)
MRSIDRVQLWGVVRLLASAVPLSCSSAAPQGAAVSVAPTAAGSQAAPMEAAAPAHLPQPRASGAAGAGRSSVAPPPPPTAAAGRVATDTTLVVTGAVPTRDTTEAVPPEVHLASPDWTSYGHDLYNTRHAPAETAIGRENVAQLELLWSWTTSAVTSTPAYRDGILYFVDFQSYRVAVDAASGAELWRFNDPASPTGRLAASPTAEADALYYGVDGATWCRVNRTTGALEWSVQVDAGGSTQSYSSLTRIGGLVIAGMASFRNVNPVSELLGEKPFAGSIIARAADTGAEAWKFLLTTGEGVGVVSTPAIDPMRKRLFVGTGNNYDATDSPYADSLLALEYETGEYAWHVQYTAGDEYSQTVSDGPDVDVLAAPILFSVDGVAMVAAGDKAGSFRAFDRDGKPMWMRQLSVGGHHGGVMGSPAYHAGVIYVCSGDFTTDSGQTDGQSGPAQSTLFALDAANGDIVWSKPIAGLCYGALSHANGLVYLPAGDGFLRVFDDRSGDELWSAPLGASSAGGVTVAGGKVFVSYGWDWALPGVSGGVKAFALP